MTTRLRKAKAIQLLIFHFLPENIPQESKVQLTCYRDSSRKNHWACSRDYRSQSRLHGRQFSFCQYSERSRHLSSFRFDIPDLVPVSLFLTGKALGMSCLPKQTKRKRANEMVREKVSSVVFQISFCFCLILGTAGDSSSQTDTNTIVGKPKLGKKGNKIYRS